MRASSLTGQPSLYKQVLGCAITQNYVTHAMLFNHFYRGIFLPDVSFETDFEFVTVLVHFWNLYTEEV